MRGDSACGGRRELIPTSFAEAIPRVIDRKTRLAVQKRPSWLTRRITHALRRVQTGWQEGSTLLAESVPESWAPTTYGAVGHA